MAVGGAMSRTAVNSSAGVKSPTGKVQVSNAYYDYH